MAISVPFASPPPNLSIIEGFLAMRDCLMMSAPNVTLIGFIKDAPDPHSQHHHNAEAVLHFHDEKQNQMKHFALLMNWVTDVSDKVEGLGYSDVTMDFVDLSMGDGVLLDSAIGFLGKEDKDRKGGLFVFFNAVAPVVNLLLESTYLMTWFYELLQWAARHWMRAGKLATDWEWAVNTYDEGSRATPWNYCLKFIHSHCGSVLIHIKHIWPCSQGSHYKYTVQSFILYRFSRSLFDRLRLKSIVLGNVITFFVSTLQGLRSCSSI
jgi:hypothetical protein